MQMLFRTPHPALAPFVESIWYYASDKPNLRERIMPSGSMGLLVNLDEDELRAYHGPDLAQIERIRGAAVCGAWARSFGIDGAEQHRVVGVSFLAGGAAPFLGCPSHVVAEQHVELAELWGDDGRVLRERLLEAPSPAAALRTVERVLLARAAGSLDPDHALRFAVAALESGASVAQVRDRLGLSVRAMLRAFRDAVGLTPKVYARVRRFQRVLGKAAPAVEPDWADLATSCGYYDQAHLIRDFRELADLTPTAYAPVAPDAHNHAVHRA